MESSTMASPPLPCACAGPRSLLPNRLCLQFCDQILLPTSAFLVPERSVLRLTQTNHLLPQISQHHHTAGICIDGMLYDNVGDQFAQTLQHQPAICLDESFREDGGDLLALTSVKWNIEKGSQFDPGTYVPLLRRCGNVKAISDGKLVHDHIVRSGHNEGKFLANLLVQMYGKWGAIEDARSVFDQMYERNVFSWNLMLAAYTHQGHGKKALSLFDQMWKTREKPNEVTFISVLTACTTETSLREGSFIHSCIIDCGFHSDIVVCTALMNMYGRCKSLDDAQRVFDLMHQRDVVVWNALIGLHVQQKHGHYALQLYQEMQKEGMMPDQVTFLIVLDACIDLAALPEAKTIHAFIQDRGLNSNVIIGNALVNMYSKCGSLVDSQLVFSRMNMHDIVSWNAMIAAYIEHGNDKEALKVYQQMPGAAMKPDEFTFSTILCACSSVSALTDGRKIHANIVEQRFESDVVVATALIEMYNKCGCLEDARKVFDRIYQKTVYAWTAMIGACTQHGEGKEALQLFQHMQQNRVKPDEITFANVLGACASLSALAEGKAIHLLARNQGYESDIVVGATLVNMYSKCGSLTDAQIVFDNMHYKDVVSWNAMVAAYTQHGLVEKVLHLFSKMQADGVKPNGITFMCILSACSRAGLVDQGCHYFDSMTDVYGIIPTVEHYGCMIDLFGRSGRLKEAEDVIRKMPFEPSALVWETLLGACQIYGDVERGKRAAEHVIQLDILKDSPYVLLSNIYAAEGRWDDVAKVRKTMSDLGVKKIPGFSSIEVRNSVHNFVVRDRSHPQREEIYNELDRLSRQMKEAGYVPDTKLVLHDVEEELKEHLLSYHSEKLAVAFGVLNTTPGSPLRIIKNLRVCGDCHSAFKIISQVTGREIFLRDANRFHQFLNGLCSCADYW